MSWLWIFLGFSALIILHEAGHFVAAKATGMRVERFFLFFPPKIVSVKRGETEYGIAAIPRGRLREDQRHEPRRGAAAGGRAPRLLPPAGLEADRRDRRRPGGQHRARLRDPLRASRFGAPGRRPRPVGEVVPRTPGQRRARSRATASSRSTAAATSAATEQRARRVRARGRHPQLRRQADGRLRRDDAGQADGRARRAGRDGPRHARIQRRGRAGPWSASPSAAKPVDLGRRRGGRPAPATSCGW